MLRGGLAALLGKHWELIRHLRKVRDADEAVGILGKVCAVFVIIPPPNVDGEQARYWRVSFGVGHG